MWTETLKNTYTLLFDFILRESTVHMSVESRWSLMPSTPELDSQPS